MSLAVVCRLDAEPQMERLLSAIKAHPDQREFVVNLILSSFTESFHMIRPPYDLVMYCMSDLHWEEIHEFAKQEMDKDVKTHGRPTCGIWSAILDSFHADWRSTHFRDFTKSPPGTAG